MRIGNTQRSGDLNANMTSRSVKCVPGDTALGKWVHFSAGTGNMLLFSFILSALLIISSEARGLITWFAMIMIGMIIYGLLRGKQIVRRTQTRIRRRDRQLCPLTASVLPFVQIEMLTMVILLALICLGIFYTEMHYQASIKVQMRKLKTRVTKVVDQYFKGIIVLSVLVVVIMIILSGSLTS